MCLIAEEKKLWIASLEEEEKDRLGSLLASMNALEPAENPTPHQVNALLVSAFLGQLTLMRASRVFPDRSSSKRTNVDLALAHAPTAELARRLHHCWKALGVTPTTLRTLLQQAVFTVGTQTRDVRASLCTDLLRHPRRGVDPRAQKVFTAEASGQSQLALRGLQIPGAG